MKKLAGILAVLCCTALLVWGQGAKPAPEKAPNPNAPRVTARFIPDSIAIGDHFKLRIEVTKDIVQQVGFPQPDSTGMLTNKIEVLADLPPDTVKVENRRITLAKEYLLTCFDAGRYGLKKIPVLYLDKNITDTIFAKPDSIILQVGTFEIDTLTQTIYDIKRPMAMPLRAGEFLGWLLAGLFFLFLVGATIYFVRKWREQGVPWKRKLYEPPHVTAIRTLEALHHQKLWQNNKHKLYYTLLTDIVRAYIEGRWGVSAMEMTTDELLAAMRDVEISETDRMRLASMLRTADLAKFAKYAPEADDNEAAYNDAYYFVEDTKPTEVEPSTDPQE